MPSSSFIVFDSFEEEEFRETATHLVYAKSLMCISTRRGEEEEERGEEERGGGEGRTLITSVKMVGRRDVYEAVASNYALTGAVKPSRLPRSCVILVFVTSSGNRETPQVAAFVFSFFFSRDQFFFFYEKLILFKLIRIELIGLKIFLKKLIGKLRFFVTLEYIRRNLSIFRIRKIQFIVKSIYRNFLTIIRKGDDEMKL